VIGISLLAIGYCPPGAISIRTQSPIANSNCQSTIANAIANYKSQITNRPARERPAQGRPRA
jgi:hypothetical protein